MVGVVSCKKYLCMYSTWFLACFVALAPGHSVAGVDHWLMIGTPLLCLSAIWSPKTRDRSCDRPCDYEIDDPPMRVT